MEEFILKLNKEEFILVKATFNKMVDAAKTEIPSITTEELISHDPQLASLQNIITVLERINPDSEHLPQMKEELKKVMDSVAEQFKKWSKGTIGALESINKKLDNLALKSEKNS